MSEDVRSKLVVEFTSPVGRAIWMKIRIKEIVESVASINDVSIVLEYVPISREKEG